MRAPTAEARHTSGQLAAATWEARHSLHPIQQTPVLELTGPYRRVVLNAGNSSEIHDPRYGGSAVPQGQLASAIESFRWPQADVVGKAERVGAAFKNIVERGVDPDRAKQTVRTAWDIIMARSREQQIDVFAPAA